MPFKSKAQQRWMFANKPKMAKKWAEETNFKKLPEKKASMGAMLKAALCKKKLKKKKNGTVRRAK